jgi:tagatose-1,6-bisphosphate aldolase
MPMLLRKKGGKKNLKRIRVMQKTYTAYWKAHKVADPAEIEKEKAIAHVRRMENMTRMSYIELSSTLGISYHCRHPIIT